jgi:hypothetical protein
VVKGISHAARLTWVLHIWYHSPSIIRQTRKDEQDHQDGTSKMMSRDRATLARCITLGATQN